MEEMEEEYFQIFDSDDSIRSIEADDQSETFVSLLPAQFSPSFHSLVAFK